ncbi:MAG: ClpX C4-type zinc finger protein [Caulobacteraceae bacterium]|nr:ClpX C4-type zinc finger protein [Caulobacteraceae bacterium]
MSESETPERAHREIHCSFCGKSQVDVDMIVAGPGVKICNECVELAANVIAETQGKPRSPQTMFQDHRSTDQLLHSLKLHDGAFESVGKAMQDIVDILREREVSWSQIGEALGVTRQAAWKRFA